MTSQFDRARRRRRLLAWSAPVVALAVIAGLYFTSLWALNAWGVSRYAEDAEGAGEVFEVVQRWNGPIEVWRAHFNTGTADFASGRIFDALPELREALRHVPTAPPAASGAEGQKDPEAPECRVRRNLSLTVEAIGDDVALEDGDEEMAATFWADAQEIIGPCVEDEENAESAERQQQKQREAEGQQQPPEEDDGGADPEDPDGPDDGEDPGDSDGADPTPEATPTPDPTEDPKREELEERNREAERERQQQQERGGGGYGGGQNW
ncbi:MAG TPA: hypothetical protein VK024_07295 [Actinomycetaceae bacterium]|nr:hypothetical protein [Actinomycetaceae bacterium]